MHPWGNFFYFLSFFSFLCDFNLFFLVIFFLQSSMFFANCCVQISNQLLHHAWEVVCFVFLTPYSNILIPHVFKCLAVHLLGLLTLISQGKSASREKQHY
jgi:hypothetical protein